MKLETLCRVGNPILRSILNDLGLMGTTAKESLYVSARKGNRLENCVNGCSSFSDMDLCQPVMPDVAKAPHPSEIPLVEEQTDQAKKSGGTEAGAFPNILLGEPTSGDTLRNDLPSDPQESSVCATEQSLIDRIRSGQRELFIDLVRPHQRTVYGTHPSVLPSWQVGTPLPLRIPWESTA